MKELFKVKFEVTIEATEKVEELLDPVIEVAKAVIGEMLVDEATKLKED